LNQQKQAMGDPEHDAVEEVILWPGGDLYLLVGQSTNTIKRFLVSSHVLQIASPVWGAMLNRNNDWAEKKEKEIEFPGDNALAVQVILRLAHLYVPPASLATANVTLYDIAVICDKYDTPKLVQHLVLNWLLETPELLDGLSPVERIFVYWTFRMQKELIEDARDLLLGSRCDEQGQLVDEHGNGLEVQTPLPRSFFGKSNHLRRFQQQLLTVM